MSPGHGVFTISLDFELYWGVRDKRTIEGYGENLRGVRKAIPEMLRIFRAHDLHATWAVVGFLFFRNADELRKAIPDLQPDYSRRTFSPYEYIAAATELDPAYHFAPDLIALIAATEGQEIATHTFSHYYCLEGGQTRDQFEEDIRCAQAVAKAHGLTIKSLVFPRNQWNEEYLSSLARLGLQCYRGNGVGRMHRASNAASQSRFTRALRLIDAYVNLSGHNTYDLQECVQQTPFNFPASRFLRPYSERVAFLDDLRLHRVKRSMTDAAVNRRLYHLWWHPHNFGANLQQNIQFLQAIADHYDELEVKYGFSSLNMGGLCEIATAGRRWQSTSTSLGYLFERWK
ncbi:polysaccharide deacetylase family protein [Paraburkholderia metrosideri]|uniref:NodB homology domain-containing protein n=1 Tax=Paraburkholderia metrosideri TaxID=580937 RepID=A0ABM8NH22_9BURK|nr:polysaccharide deacetylase family protein [Paraburkholderia metrosideri]CAD6524737.1 hypothetical protein LMG28140_01675 [Paraburkholderia metrosideri]